MDNQERRDVSWWYSRHGGRSRDWSALRRSRRITLIDMLFLAVTAGVLLPRLLQFAAAAQPDSQPPAQPPAPKPASQPAARESEHRTLGSLQVQTAENHRRGTLTLTADFSLPEPIPPEHTPTAADTSADRIVDTPLDRAADTAADTPADTPADIGITIYDHTHKPLDSVFDLPPAPGRSRQLTVSAPSSAAAYCILSSGRRRIRIELTPEDD